MTLILALFLAWLITGGGPVFVRDARTKLSPTMKSRATKHGASSASWWLLGALRAARYLTATAWRGWGSHRRWAKAKIDAYRAKRPAGEEPPDDDSTPPPDQDPPKPKRPKPEVKTETKPAPKPSIEPATPAVRLVPTGPVNTGDDMTEMIVEANGYEEIRLALQADVDRLESYDPIYEQRMENLRKHKADDDTIEHVSKARELNEQLLLAAREGLEHWETTHGAVYDIETATGARGDAALRHTG
ncbi:MAG: hypothetical protein JWN52_6714 [Actinomycetia bacterium]|nr:hypothetical protein [Actinomycetes bacterium]